MEITAQSLSSARPPNCSTSPSLPKAPLLSFHSATFLGYKSLPAKLPCIKIKGRQHRIDLGVVHASAAERPSTDDTERWLLEPVGDGDTKHIGFKVTMPDAFEVASSVVTVGRLPEKADMVIPVATVSGVHARIQKKARGSFGHRFGQHKWNIH
ncbi:hypothetical protein F0562_022429 [Nyssa sinensis]|uniref:FHA domain-containing protein n=1 Tax=Nyssa sinensis TaxID=561372 RepID=A0A5J5BRR0_9ASTE|nr:hypothetical protein F0562_022429 [Nyssa sinensis]